MKVKFVLPVLFVLCGLQTFAQGDVNLEDLIKGSASDANYLVQGYVEPLLKGVGYGLNQGWYNTAAPHKIGGIDLTFPVSFSAMLVPSGDTQFQIDNSKLTSLERINSAGVATNGPAQTVMGTKQETTLRFKVGSGPQAGSTISMPGGLDLKNQIGINAVPFVMLQLGIGLPKSTDLKVRYLPDLQAFGDDVDVNLFGIGVMHDVKQWIPGIKNLPLSLSGFVGYTKLKVGVRMGSPTASNNGTANYEVSATTIQALISKKLSVLTLYGGVGVNIAKSDVNVTGRFDTDDNGTQDQNLTILANAASSGPRATAGFRLKLAIFTIHADYTLQKYNAFNAGLGLSIR